MPWNRRVREPAKSSSSSTAFSSSKGMTRRNCRHPGRCRSSMVKPRLLANSWIRSTVSAWAAISRGVPEQLIG